MEERIRLTRRKLQIPYTAKEHNRQGTSQCYTEKAPNAWQRRGTQKTRNTYNQPNRPNRPNRQTSQTKHQAERTTSQCNKVGARNKVVTKE